MSWQSMGERTAAAAATDDELRRPKGGRVWDMRWCSVSHGVMGVSKGVSCVCVGGCHVCRRTARSFAPERGEAPGDAALRENVSLWSRGGEGEGWLGRRGWDGGEGRIGEGMVKIEG